MHHDSLCPSVASGGRRVLSARQADEPHFQRRELRKHLMATKEPCGQCTRFDRSGSNAVYERKMCLDCGTTTTTRRVQPAPSNYLSRCVYPSKYNL